MRLLAKEVTYCFVIFEKGKMGIKNGYVQILIQEYIWKYMVKEKIQKVT
jgi:hypothetical protein